MQQKFLIGHILDDVQNYHDFREKESFESVVYHQIL